MYETPSSLGLSERMECARLSDAELLPLLREESESWRDAFRELERRHLHAVRAFAGVCTVSPAAADELAENAWRRATTLREGMPPVGAVRPYALSSVLRTTADWAGTAKRGDLHDELITWIQNYVSEGRGDSSADDFPCTSMAARAFGSLPAHTQTVLWHYGVEYDGVARIDQLLGSGTEELSTLDRRARRDFYNAYVRIHEQEIRDEECHRLHRTVLAYADQRSIETAADLTPHLERCAHCAQAVDDLGLMHVHCGALLAEALLPWGGPEYAASSLPSSTGTFRTAAGQAVGQDALDSARAGTASGAAAAAGDGRDGRSYEGRLAGGLRGLVSERWGRLTGRRLPGGSSGGSTGGESTGAHDGDGRRRRQRKLVMQSAALVALCSVAAAVVWTGVSSPDSPQSSEPPPQERAASQGPVPGSGPAEPRPTATATSTVTATPSTRPPGGGDDRPGGGSGVPARDVPVADAAVVWLFDAIDGNGTTTGDSSANGIIGTLFGDPLPKLVNGALEFNGNQGVSSDGPVLDTGRSFSVSARVKLLDKGSTQAVVSQDGTDVSGFALGYDSGQDRWSMVVPDDDSQEAGKSAALSKSPPKAGAWTHLTGVYDDPDNQLRLYVDGRLQDSVTRAADWRAEGDFAVGRALLGGALFQGLRGAADDVRAFDRALTGGEARGLAAGS